MNETRMDWTDLQLFLAVAREGGLSRATQTTGRSAATLGRRMQTLERALGRELFVRHDRGYELTGEGRELLDRLLRIETDLARATTPLNPKVKPVVKISAGTWTTMFLLQHIHDLQGNPADLRLRFLSTEATLDIAHRETMLGFRTRPTEPGLAGRKLSRVEFAGYGKPDAPDHWILVRAKTPSSLWLQKKVGQDAIVEVSAPRSSLDLALKGIGNSLLPTFIGDRQAGLVRRGSTIPELAHDQWLVTHQDDRHLPEVRRAINRIYALYDSF